jgi:nucleoid-associated protein YgaU
VRPGDSYWSIAKAHYGSVRYFAALAEFNRSRIPDPGKMKPGIQVAIPDPAVLEAQYPQLFRGTPAAAAPTGPQGDAPGKFFVENGEPIYRVGPGDTLSSIAQKHLGRASRWEQIYGMNRELLPTPDRLRPGTLLRLPRDASQVALTPDAPPGR